MGINTLPCSKCRQVFRDEDLFGDRDEELVCFSCRKEDIASEKNSRRERIKKILNENSNLNDKQFSNLFNQFFDIIMDIKNIVGRDSEINPDYYGEIFFKIMLLGDIPDKDKRRYFSYSIKRTEECLNKHLDKK